MNVCADGTSSAEEAIPKLVFTRHAIERFRQRHASHLVSREAEALLKQLVPLAVKLDEKSFRGQDQWLVDEPDQPRFVFLTKRDPAVGVVLVTVLDASMQAPTRDELDEVADAARRLAPSFTRYPVVSYQAPPTPVAPVVVVPARPTPPAQTKKQAQKAAKRAAALVTEGSRAKKRADDKARHVVLDAERQVTASVRKSAPCPTPVESPAQVTRLRRHASLCEGRMNNAKHVARTALRALRSLVGTDLGASLAWEAIRAFDPDMISDNFIDYEKPVKVASLELAEDTS